MKWFKHETDAHANIKLQEVIDLFGLEGYGYYWACLELVANQGTNYTLKKDKRWSAHLEKFLSINIEKQKKFLVKFAKIGLIDKDSLRKGDLYIPKLEQRQDEYSIKLRRVSGQAPESVVLEQKRTDKKRRERVSAHISYLKKIPEKDLEEFYQRFDASKKAIKSKGEDLFLWCEANGKHKSNYKATLLNALKKDFPERKEPPRKPIEIKVEMPEPSDERVPIPEDIKLGINKIINGIKKVVDSDGDKK